MAKMESTFKNMVVSLLGITVIASASLGLVNDATKSAIAKAESDNQTKAIATVLPKFEKLNESEKVLPKEGKDSVELFRAVDANGNIVGTAIKSYSYKGFSGYIEIMVGFENDGKVSGYQVLKHAETPGLGTKMGTWFNDQNKQSQNIIGKYPGTNGFKVKKDGGDIDAITAATISSRAFLDAVNRAYSTISQDFDGQTSATTGATKPVKEE